MLNFARLNSLNSALRMERLSGGKRINRVADDPSGLHIAKGLEAQTRGLRMAVQNAQDGISFLQTRDGVLAETHDMLMRLRDLAVRAGNIAVLTDEQRQVLANEGASLLNELNRINQSARFNSRNLFDRSFDTVPGGSAALVHDGQITLSANLAAYGNTVRVRAAFFNGAADFPDFNLISPDGTEAFGYLYGYNQTGGSETVESYVPESGAQTVNRGDGDKFSLGTMDSANRIDYNGYAPGVWPGQTYDVEEFVITNPTAGVWTLVIDNEAAASKDFAIYINEEPEAPVNPPNELQIGANAGSEFIIERAIYEVSAFALRAAADFTSANGPATSLDGIDYAINAVSDRRAQDGAVVRRLQHVIDDNMAAIINQEAGRSRIEDADMAVEITELTKVNILSQANLSAIYNEGQILRSATQMLLGAIENAPKL